MTMDASKPIFPVVMTPSHDGKLFCNYTRSLLNLVSETSRLGMPMQVFFREGESLVTRARNQCVADFLANPQWTHLFWIDADIGFSPQAAMRLLNSGYEVAAGVYPLKGEFWPEMDPEQGVARSALQLLTTRYTVNCKPAPGDDQVRVNVQPDGFIEVDEAPTGFMVIARSVFEEMMQAFPELQYVPDSHGVQDMGLHYRFFDVMVDPDTRRYLSEDYGFCRLLQRMGKSVFVDACSNLTHHGYKTYRGNFAQALVQAPAFALGAPKGLPFALSGTEYLRPNDGPI